MPDEDQKDARLAPILPLFSKDQLGEHATTLVQLVESPGYQGDHDQQTKSLVAAQRLWPQLGERQRGAVREAITKALSIDRQRFHALLELTDLADLRRALHYKAPPFKRDKDELFYPAKGDGWLGDYVEYAQPGEAHVGWHFWSGLTILSAAIRRNFYTMGGHSKKFANIYVLLEGPSGVGKNTAIGRAKDVLERMNQRLREKAISPEALQLCPTVYVFASKVTPPKLVMHMDEYGEGKRRVGDLRFGEHPDDTESCGLIVAEEATTLLDRQQFGSDQLIGILTDAYDGKLADDTVARGAKILNNVHLSMLLGSTIYWLRHSMTPQVFQGGFMGARMLIISKLPTSRCYPREPVMDPLARDMLVNKLCEYAQHDPCEMMLDNTANDLYEEWYRNRTKTHEDERIHSYFSRKRVQLEKLAILISVSRWHQPWIKGEDMEYALRLLEHEEPGMLGAFREILTNEQTGHIEWVLKAIRAAGGHASMSELWRRSRNRMARQALEEALFTLTKMGEVGVREGPHYIGGRPFNVWYRTDMEDREGNRVVRLVDGE